VGKDVGKAPLLGQGWQHLRPREQDVLAWWRKWPQANIGILLEPSGLLVIDLDSEAALQEALARGLPPGPVSRTGTGEHRFYRAEGITGRTTKRGAAGGIDVLASGFVVVPPSRHRSGKWYTWLLHPDEAPPQEPPSWVRDLLVSAPRISAPHPTQDTPPRELPIVSVASLHVPERIKQLITWGDTEGRYPSRSEALFAVVTALVAAGYDDDTITAVVWGHTIGEKAREQGWRWLRGEVLRARLKSRAAPGRRCIWVEVV